jgi:NAD-dependent DNA ligase
MNTIDQERQWLIDRNKEYRAGDPTVSDAVYDERYYKFCEQYPDDILAQDSVMEEIPDDNDKEKMPIAMFSLNKKKSIQEIRSWAKNKGLPEDVELIATSKYDGISLCNDEETNNKTLTRGDGFFGQNRTEHFKYINKESFFSSLNVNNHNFYSYGEALIPKPAWKEYFEGKINPKNGKLYKAARNTVAGLFNNKIPTPDILKHVVFMRYGLVKKSGEELSKIDQLDTLNCLNTIEVPYVVLKLNDENLKEKLDNLYKEWGKMFDIDGIVLELNDISLRQDLGREENNNPAWSIAYKNPEWAEVKKTKVISIKIGVSKQGFFNPVIGVEPVIVGGVQISNVTGYNMRYVIDNNICIGSEINIIRSGDVIPKHLQTTKFVKSDVDNYIKSLEYCPYCGTQTEWNENNIQLVCPNEKCSERMLSTLIYFFGSLEIDDFGEGEIKKLFDKGYDTPEKILTITHEELKNMEGWADKSINKLFSQFKKLREEGVPLANLMQALDLFNGKLGKKVAQKIFDEFDGDFDFENNVVERLCNIDGVSDITANWFIKGRNLYYSKYQNFPVKISYIQTPKKELTGDKYVGFSVCMTGFRDASLEDIIVKNGGIIASGVSKKTTHLLVKDKDTTSSKATKARSLGIPIMYVNEFLNL